MTNSPTDDIISQVINSLTKTMIKHFVIGPGLSLDHQGQGQGQVLGRGLTLRTDSLLTSLGHTQTLCFICDYRLIPGSAVNTEHQLGILQTHVNNNWN